MKLRFPFVLICLSMLFFSCSNLFNEQDEGSVTVDVGKAERYLCLNAYRADEDFSELEEFGLQDFDEEKLFDICKYSLVVSLSTEGDYSTSKEVSYTLII